MLFAAVGAGEDVGGGGAGDDAAALTGANASVLVVLVVLVCSSDRCEADTAEDASRDRLARATGAVVAVALPAGARLYRCKIEAAKLEGTSDSSAFNLGSAKTLQRSNNRQAYATHQ